MRGNVSLKQTFLLTGLSEAMNYRLTLFSLTLLCYCVILLLNVSLIMTIVLDKNLHEPMYILLCAFCLNGLYGTTGFYPKFLWDLLSPVHVISYAGCLIQALVMYSFACGDLYILAIMAYDRYLAICRPLEYHSIMSKKRLLILLIYSMFSPFCIISINILLSSSLKLCSILIDRLFCVNWIFVRLACFPSETRINTIVATISIIIYVCHGLFIIWSYMYLIKTCVNSIETRTKFMQTCTPHLVSLLMFVMILFFDVMNIRFDTGGLPQSLKNFVAIEFLLIPPILNPLIYGFKLTKLRNRIWGFVYLKIK